MHKKDIIRQNQIKHKITKSNDKRNTYSPQIEAMLILHLFEIRKTGKNTLFITSKSLLEMLGMINHNFYTIWGKNNVENTKIIAQARQYDYENFYEYLHKTYEIVDKILNRVLLSIAKRSLITINTGYLAFTEANQYTEVFSTSDLGHALTSIEQDTLAELNCAKFENLYINNNTDTGKKSLMKEYYNVCEKKIIYHSNKDKKWIENGWNYKMFYRCKVITLVDDSNFQEVISSDILNDKEILNTKIIELLKNTIRLSFLTEENRTKYVTDTEILSPDINYLEIIKNYYDRQKDEQK